MFRRRLVSAGVLIGLVVLSAWLDVYYPFLGQRGAWMLPVFLVMTLGTVWEMSSLLARRWPVSPIAILMHSLVAISVALVPLWYGIVMGKEYPSNQSLGWVGWIVVGTIVSVFTMAAGAIRSYSRVAKEHGTTEAEGQTLAWFASVAVVAYAVTPMAMLWPIRMFGGAIEGMANLIGIIFLAKIADVGAYLVGKKFGKTKLCPTVSPGKTVEGLIGGFAASLVGAYICYKVIFPALGIPGGGTLWGPAVLSGLLTVGGLVGDLTESMVKRTVGAKDSGGQVPGLGVPGLGGIWDVTDSLLPAAVIGYLGILAGLN